MNRAVLLAAALFAFALIGGRPLPAAAPAPGGGVSELPGSPPANAGGAFGIASGAEWSGDHPRLFPLLREAGVTTVRQFPEWPGFQPAPGQWSFASGDRLILDARKNSLEIFGVLCYLAPFASSAPPGSDHGASTRTFPVKDMQYWRDYVEGVVTRYRRDVKYWEVYNEFNSGAFARNATVKDYVGLVRDAYTTAKRIDPQCKIGIGCADVDLSFLEQAIVQGAGGHFDFINVHPYSLMDAAMAGHEPVFLRMGENLRKMLAKTGQRKEIALWVSEIGRTATDQPEPERKQAEAIVKAYVLCFAQGIERVFWFEGRGPAYGAGGDFGIVRRDWTKRPSFEALRALTAALGPRPRYLGWHNPTGASYGFLFQGPAGPVLVAWASGDAGDRLRFPGAVTVTDLAGRSAAAPANEDVALTRAPVLISGLPAPLVAQARARGGEPFPWLKDYSKAETVSCQMGAANVESGVALHDRGDGKTVVGLVEGAHVRRTDRANKMYYVYFDVDDSYASVGDRELEITVVARRTDAAREAGCNIVYESATGYRNLGEWFGIPAGEGWHRHTFRLKDANFANNWGWNFRLEAVASPSDFWVKEVIVKRVGERK